MSLVRLPSVLIDAVAEDFLDAAAGTVISTLEEPFAITDGQQLELEVDGGAPQQVQFNEVDFDDITAASAAEVVAVINAGITGAIAVVDAGRVRITTLTMGAGGAVEITDEPDQPVSGDPSFDFPTGPQAGTDATVQTLLVNRVPEPDETAIPLAGDVELEIYRAGGAAPASVDVRVTIAGVLVLSAGSAHAGWSVAFSLPDSSTRRVVLTPPADFDTDVVVVVLVEVPGLSFSSSYSFRTLDLVRPRAVSAVAQDKRRIRVTFSEAVQQEDPTAAGDALHAASYIIDRATRPAVSLRVESVAPVSATEIDITTDIEMTFGAGYELTVVAVLDLAGNPHVVAPDNAVTFQGFLPAFPDGRRFVLTDFLPALNVGEDHTGDLRMFMGVLQEVTNLLISDIDEWARILDPDLAPERFVDAMLEDLGNPFSFDLSDVDKRRLLRILVRLYQLKGTRWGVIDSILFFLGISVTVQTYAGTGWELTAEGADPDVGDELSSGSEDSDDPAVLGPDRRGIYSFRVVSPADLTSEQRDQIRILAEYMMVGHEHYLGTIEPTSEDALDHLVLGFSELGGSGGPGDWVLH